MRPAGHLLTSAAFSAGLYAGSGSAVLAGSVFVGGTLIDLDHYLDYVVLADTRDFSPGAFLNFYGTHQYRHIVLLLHSWELLAAWFLALLIWPQPVALGLWIGCMFHLALDVGFNAPRIQQPIAFYSLAYRAARRFDKDRLLQPEDALPGSTKS